MWVTCKNQRFFHLLIRSQAGKSLQGYQLASGPELISAALGISGYSSWWHRSLRWWLHLKVWTGSCELLTQGTVEFFFVFFSSSRYQEKRKKEKEKKTVCIYFWVEKHLCSRRSSWLNSGVEVLWGSLASSDPACTRRDLRRDEMPLEIQYVGVLIKSAFSMIVSFKSMPISSVPA